MIELADIIAPVAPPPAPPPYEWIAFGVTLFVLVLFFLLRLWLKRTHTRRWARAALKRTERELKLGKLDARTAAFQIAHAVKCAAPLQKNMEAWPEFIKHLDQARFSPKPIGSQQVTQLLAQAHQWIGRTP